jgi:hypothetical protein
LGGFFLFFWIFNKIFAPKFSSLPIEKMEIILWYFKTLKKYEETSKFCLTIDLG